MYYTKEQIRLANETDLAEYLGSKGIQLRRSGGQWIWEENQVWVRGYKWYTHYESKGGYAVGFVMKYFNMTFPDAVAALLGDRQSVIPKAEPKKKVLNIPHRNKTMDCVFAYLMKERKIDRDVIEYFAHVKTLYEDDEHHNAVFVGTDFDGAVRHIHKRSTNKTGTFRMTESGSDARFSFHHIGTSDRLYVFEAPIDMLAYITLNKTGWQSHSYLALCCTVGQSMMYQLQMNPHIRKVFLCLDNDKAGEKGCGKLRTELEENGYTDIVRLTPILKDWDEDLKADIKTESDDIDYSVLDDIISDCEDRKIPQYAWEKVKQSYNRFKNIQTQEQCRKLTELLLLFIRDEYRKNEKNFDWDEINKQIRSCESVQSVEITFTKLAELRDSGRIVSYSESSVMINSAIDAVNSCIGFMGRRRESSKSRV